MLCNQGLLKCFGIDLGNPGKLYDEGDVRVFGHGAFGGTKEGGRPAMERLLREKPKIDLVYAINEPAAAGVHATFNGSWIKNDVLIVSVDGGYQGARSVTAGVHGATAMKFPVRMARLGVEAVVEFV